MSPSLTQTITEPVRRQARARAAVTRVSLAPTQKLLRVHLAANARPLTLAAMQEAATRVAAQAGAQLKTSLTAHARLLPATMNPAQHLASSGLFAVLDFGGESAGLLELDARATAALLHHLGGAKSVMGPAQRLTPIEEAGLGWTLLSALAAARDEAALSAFTPRLLTVTLDRAQALELLDARRRHVAMAIELMLGDARAQARLLLPALWLQSKLDELPSEPAPEPSPSMNAARVPVRLRVGRSLLPASELTHLEPGDIIFIGNSQLRDAGLFGTARLLGASFELRGTLSEAGFTLSEALPRPTQEPTMSATVDPTIPVEVEIELTRLRLPLHQLGSIRQGAVLPLHINAAQHVVVRIGDKAVAKAELVEIEGEVGARVVAML